MNITYCWTYSFHKKRTTNRYQWPVAKPLLRILFLESDSTWFLYLANTFQLLGATKFDAFKKLLLVSLVSTTTDTSLWFRQNFFTSTLRNWFSWFFYYFKPKILIGFTKSVLCLQVLLSIRIQLVCSTYLVTKLYDRFISAKRIFCSCG